MAAEKTPTVKRQRNSSPMYKDYQLLPPVLPIRAGRSEALDALHSELAEMRLFHPQWAEQVGWDVEKMRREQPGKLSQIEDLIESTARLVISKNPNVGGVEADPNAPVYRYAANLVMASDAYKVPLNLMTGIMLKESTGYLNARSKVGAVGLMQLHYPAHSKPGGILYGLTESEAMRPQTNIWMAAKLCSDFLKSANNNIARCLYAYVGDRSGKSKEAQNYKNDVFAFMGNWNAQASQVNKEREKGQRQYFWIPITEAWEQKVIFENLNKTPVVNPAVLAMDMFEPLSKQEANLLALQYPVLNEKIHKAVENGAGISDLLTVRKALQDKEAELRASDVPAEEIDKVFHRTPETKELADKLRQEIKENSQKRNEIVKEQNSLSSFNLTTGLTVTSLVTGLAVTHLLRLRAPTHLKIGLASAEAATGGLILAASQKSQQQEIPDEIKNAAAKMFAGKELPQEIKQNQQAMVNYERLVRDAESMLQGLNMSIPPKADAGSTYDAKLYQTLFEKLTALSEVQEKPEVLCGPYRRVLSEVREGKGTLVREEYRNKMSAAKRKMDNAISR